MFVQVERLNQQQWAAKLLKQEQKLEQRENLLLQHQPTLHKVCGVKGEVHDRVRALQQVGILRAVLHGDTHMGQYFRKALTV